MGDFWARCPSALALPPAAPAVGLWRFPTRMRSVVVHSWGGGSASHSTGREGLQVWDGACWARMDLGGSWRRQENTAGLKPRVELLLLQSEWNSLATSPQTGDQQKQLGRKSCFGWDLEGSELEIRIQGLTLSACLVFRSYR